MDQNPQIKLDYDDDTPDIIDKINEALERIGYKLVADGGEYCGYIILFLEKTESRNKGRPRKKTK